MIRARTLRRKQGNEQRIRLEAENDTLGLFKNLSLRYVKDLDDFYFTDEDEDTTIEMTLESNYSFEQGFGGKRGA